MSSPVLEILSHILYIDPNSKVSKYEQFATQIIRLIQSKQLNPGMLLPGTRPLAKTLGVHRKTIISTYHYLEYHGWITVLPQEGTYVRYFEQRFLPGSDSISVKQEEQLGFAYNPPFYLQKEPSKVSSQWTITKGIPIQEEEPSTFIHQFYQKYKQQSTLSVDTHPRFNHPYLLSQIKNYLFVQRGLKIEDSHIHLAPSYPLLLQSILTLFVQHQGVLVLGEIDDPLVYQTAHYLKIPLLTMPVDEEGLLFEDVLDHPQSGAIRAIYLHSYHHMPTGQRFSIKRKKKLLQMAKAHGWLIIENVSDVDYHYGGPHTHSLYQLDPHYHVIQLSRFDALPSIVSLGLFLGPPRLVEDLERYHYYLYPQKNFLLERLIAMEISEGIIGARLRRTLPVYRHRRQKVYQALVHYFSHDIDFYMPPYGLGLWIQFRQRISMHQFLEKCHTKGLYIPAELVYQDYRYCGLRIGFSDLEEASIDPIFALLYEAYMELL